MASLCKCATHSTKAYNCTLLAVKEALHKDLLRNKLAS